MLSQKDVELIRYLYDHTPAKISHIARRMKITDGTVDKYISNRTLIGKTDITCALCTHKATHQIDNYLYCKKHEKMMSEATREKRKKIRELALQTKNKMGRKTT